MTAIQKTLASQAAPVIAKAVESSGGNLLYCIQALVLRINSQLSQLSRNSQEDSQKMKKEYRIYSAKTADFQRKQGANSWWFSQGSLASTVLGLGVGTLVSSPKGNEFFKMESKTGELLGGAIQGLGKTISDGIGAYGQDSTSELRKDETIANARFSLLQTEIGNKDAQSSDQSNLKQILDQILSSIREAFRSASR